MSGTEHAAKRTGLSQFVDAWKVFQKTKSKLDGLQLLFVMDNIRVRIFDELQRDKSFYKIKRFDAETIIPIYEALWRKAKLPTPLFSGENLTHFETLLTNAIKKGSEAASNLYYMYTTFYLLPNQTSQKEEETDLGGLDNEKQIALFNKVLDTEIPAFSIDEHMETHVLPKLEELYKQIAGAKQHLAELRRDKSSAASEQLDSLDSLIKNYREYSPENRDLMKGALGALHATDTALFSVENLKTLLTLPPSRNNKNPRQEYFEKLLQKARDKKLSEKDIGLIEERFHFIEQINRQFFLLNPQTLTSEVQEHTIISQLYREAVLEDFHNLDEGLLKDFKDVESGRRQLLRHLLEHFKKAYGIEEHEAQITLRSSIQSADTFDLLLQDLESNDILSERTRQEINLAETQAAIQTKVQRISQTEAQTNAAYAKLLFDLQKDSFEVCRKFNAVVNKPDDSAWTEFKTHVTRVSKRVDDNKFLLSKKIDFFPFLQRTYLKILHFFGLTQKRAEYVAAKYEKDLVPVSSLSFEDLRKNVAQETSQEQEPNHVTTESSRTDKTSSSTITVSGSSSSDVSQKMKNVTRRTATLTRLDSDHLKELAKTYQTESLKETRQQARPSLSKLSPAHTLLAVVEGLRPKKTKAPSAHNRQPVKKDRPPEGPGLRLLADTQRKTSASAGDAEPSEATTCFKPGQ